MLVHLLSMAHILLARTNRKPAIDINKVFRAKYQFPDGSEPDGNYETYMKIYAQADDIPIILEAGKGVGTDDQYPYYGITLNGSKGKIEIFCGTEKTDPYLRVAVDSRSYIQYTFVDSGVGYAGTLFNFLLKVYGSNKYFGVTSQERFDSAVASVETIEQALSKSEDIPLLSYPIGEKL